jgi:hypothetical protein
MSVDRQKLRRQMLALAREMATEFPSAGYCAARQQFGLLGKIRRISANVMPTARQCWEYVGLDRTHLVDEFEFAHLDLASKAHYTRPTEFLIDADQARQNP